MHFQGSGGGAAGRGVPSDRRPKCTQQNRTSGLSSSPRGPPPQTCRSSRTRLRLSIIVKHSLTLKIFRHGRRRIESGSSRSINYNCNGNRPHTQTDFALGKWSRREFSFIAPPGARLVPATGRRSSPAPERSLPSEMRPQLLTRPTSRPRVAFQSSSISRARR